MWKRDDKNSITFTKEADRDDGQDAQYLSLSVSRRALIFFFWCDLIVWHMFCYNGVPDH